VLSELLKGTLTFSQVLVAPCRLTAKGERPL
jgi:hypothetical protein